MFVRLLLFACWCAAVFAQGTTIEGRVVSTSGAPVRRAVVQVGLATRSGSISAETDGDGRFSIPGLPTGSATLTLMRAGYQSSSQQIAIAAVRSVDVTITMRRLGVIYGKVTDEYGDGFGRANVTLFQRVYENGWRWQQRNIAASDPDGNFVIGDLAAGRYYLAAIDNGSVGLPGQSARYVQTFYPGSIEANSATPIEIRLDTEIRGVDIRMQKGRVFRVSGKIMGGDGVQGATVSLIPRDMPAGLQRSAAGVNLKDGTFVIDRVPEGVYYAQVQAQFRPAGATNTSVSLAGRELVTVAGRDVDNVAIQLAPGMEVAGRTRTDGTLPTLPAGAQPQAPRVMLRPREQNVGTPNSQAMPDGTFTIKNIAPGSYRVEVAGPPNAYTASIRYENEDVTWGWITLEKSGGRMEVVFKTDGARITGVARDEKGEPVLDSQVTIWSTNAGGGYIGTANTDRTGTYRFQNLPPGEYRVTAWEPKANPINAMEFLRQFDGSASTIRLEPSGQQTQDVKVVPRVAMDAAMARLP